MPQTHPIPEMSRLDPWLKSAGRLSFAERMKSYKHSLRHAKKLEVPPIEMNGTGSRVGSDASSLTSSNEVGRQRKQRRQDNWEREQRSIDRREKQQRKDREDAASGSCAQMSTGVVVQDRSKSLPYRIRENCKKGAMVNMEEEKVHDRSSNNLENVLDNRKRKRSNEREARRRHDKIHGRFIPHDQYDYTGRNRIAIPPVHQGIFGKGASSGQYVKSAKRLPDLGSKEMAKLEAEALAKVRKRNRSESVVSMDSDPNDSTSSQTNSRGQLDKAEETLKKALHELRKRRRKEKEPKTPNRYFVQESRNVEKSSSSRAQTDGDHSAYSLAQRAKHVLSKEQTKAPANPPGDEERLQAGENAEIAADSPKGKPASPNGAPPPSSTFEPRCLDPPSLAFDGNRPHQHRNAWRNQHTKDELDTFQLRQIYEAAGGPNLRFEKPIEFMLAKHNMSKQEGSEVPTPSGEIMQSGDGEQVYTYEGTKDHRTDQYLTNLRPYTCDDDRDEGFVEHELYNQYNMDQREEHEDDAMSVDDKIDTRQWLYREQEDGLFDDYLREDQNCNQFSHDHSYFGGCHSGVDVEEWYDHDVDQVNNDWVDGMSQVDQYDPHDAKLPIDVRAMTYPTQEELRHFWKNNSNLS